jgi:hypothetical protein
MIEKLTLISILTTTSTEAAKKILDQMGIRYATNVIAAIVAALMSAVVEFYPLLNSGAEIGTNSLYEFIALIFLSFIGATLGYDKAVQLIRQMKE